MNVQTTKESLETSAEKRSGNYRSRLNLCNIHYWHEMHIFYSRCAANNLPTQVTPFPVYPELHSQVKLPGLFEQMAVAAQLSSSSAHSLISESAC